MPLHGSGGVSVDPLAPSSKPCHGPSCGNAPATDFQLGLAVVTTSNQTWTAVMQGESPVLEDPSPQQWLETVLCSAPLFSHACILRPPRSR